ncbi:Retrovirus-related Pol polyprotein from transposon TNT 1-94 [Senna tora]|uniref:Retrovirus-related Pol polyprotein from transposon TNT 1-94 n=1 Tax=Senna tora TaxID=362788 RepID=A0A834WP51_9FABA|nr:Retrovirus-related Pol polyprotein from transposon TNT 1-94 [Senna tora]
MLISLAASLREAAVCSKTSRRKWKELFDKTGLGKMTYFLGMEVFQCNMGIFLSQKKFATSLLRRFKMEHCKSVSTPLIPNLKVYAKSWGNSHGSSKACSEVTQTVIGVDVLMIAKALRATYSYRAVVNQAVWLRKVLAYVNAEQKEATILFVDNKSAISMAHNPVLRGKHINIKFHAVREAEKNGEVKIQHCTTNDQLADIFTKPLPRRKFNVLRVALGVSSKNLKEEM